MGGQRSRNGVLRQGRLASLLAEIEAYKRWYEAERSRQPWHRRYCACRTASCAEAWRTDCGCRWLH